MYIHGVTNLGMIGCIEVNDNTEEQAFFNRLRDYSRQIELEVRYSSAREGYFEAPRCPYP